MKNKCPKCNFETHYIPDELQKDVPYIMKWIESGGCIVNYPTGKKAKEFLEFIGNEK